jgi:hypothetical protein
MASFGWCVFAHVIMLSATCLVMVTAFLFCLSLFLKDTKKSLVFAFILTLTNSQHLQCVYFPEDGGPERKKKNNIQNFTCLYAARSLQLMRDKRRHLGNELLALVYINIYYYIQSALSFLYGSMMSFSCHVQLSTKNKWTYVLLAPWRRYLLAIFLHLGRSNAK